MITKWIHFFSCLLLCLPLWTWAQDDKVTVKGVVKNSKGEPLEFAEVIGLTPDKTAEMGITTGPDGTFTLELTRRPTLTIVVRHFDFSDEKIVKVATQAGKSVYTQNVQFGQEEEIATSSLDVVTVTGSINKSKIETNTSSLETVSNKRIDNFAATDIQSTVSMVPGVSIYDGQPSIRGSSGYTYGAGSRVITMLNGLPMLSAGRGSVNFDLLPTDNIKQIEIFKGAASVMYGAGAMGGVINVITDDPKETPRSSIRVRFGHFDAPANPKADWDGRSSAIRPSVHFFHSRRIGENFDFTSQVDLIKDSGYRKEEFSNRIRVLLMKQYRFQGRLKGLVIGLNTQVSIDSSATVIAWGGYPELALIPGRGFLSYQFLERYSIDPTIKYTSSGGTQYVYQGRIFHQRNGISTGQGGISTLYYNEFQFKKNFLKPKNDPDAEFDVFEAMLGLNHVRNFVEAQGVFGVATGDQLAGYFQLKYQPIKQLNIVGGMRYQFETITGDENPLKYDTTATPEQRAPQNVTKTTMNEPIFRLGVNYNPLEGTFIRASFGQALRSPGVAERFTATQAGPLVVSPNAAVQVEKGYSAEIGFRQLYRLGPKVDMGAGRKPRSRFEGFIDAAAFTMQFRNMVEFYADFARISELAAQNRFAVVFWAQNVSNASILGGELNLMVDAQVTRKFNVLLSGGATFTDPIDRNGDPALDGDDSTSKYTDLLIRIVTGQNPPIIDDRPRVLKYRNRWLVRSSIELSYGPVTFTTNYSYSSPLINVDKVFLVPFFLPQTQQFRAVNNTGWHLVDFILGFKTTKPKGLISAHVFNAFNAEYMTVPGTLGEQRAYALQYRIDF